MLPAIDCPCSSSTVAPDASTSCRPPSGLGGVGLGFVFFVQVLSPATGFSAPGAGPFMDSGALDTATSLRAVAAGDIDGDGDADLVYTDPTSGALVWLEQPSSAARGASWTSHEINDPSTDPVGGAHSVVLADLDRDGDLDVVSSARVDGIVEAWTNTLGDGSAWTSATVAATAPGVRGLGVADIDLDGRPDIVAAVTGANDLRWWRQTGGGWLGRVLEDSLNGVKELCLADIDDDGDQDVVATSPDDDAVSWWENPRTPNSTAWTAHAIGTPTDPAGLACGDLSGDGRVDVLISSSEDTVLLYVNPVASTWPSTALGSEGDLSGISSVGLADIDRNGILDPVIASTDSGLSWYFFSPEESPQYELRETATSTLSVPGFVATDLGSDGDIDLVGLVNVSGDDDQVLFVENEEIARSPLFFEADSGVVSGHQSNQEPMRFDLDGDGDRDLIYLQEQGVAGQFTLYWAENPGAQVPDSRGTPASLTVHSITEAGGAQELFVASDFAVGDFDQDGDQDIIVGEQDSAVRFLEFCENLDGAGTSWDCGLRQASDSLSQADVAGPMAAGDFDRDGDLDLIAVLDDPNGATYDGLFWLENLGDISALVAFDEHQIATSTFDVQLSPGDLDSDGDLDFVAMSSGNLVLFSNDGAVFTEGATIDGINDFEEFELGDWDRDGLIDIVVREGSAIAVYLRNSQSNETYNRLVLYSSDERGSGTQVLGGLELADMDQDGDLDVLSTYHLDTARGVEAGAPFVRLNRYHAVASRGMLPLVVELPIPATANPVGAIDLDGDGRQDFFYRERLSNDQVSLNAASNLIVHVSDISPASAEAGEEAALLTMQPAHLGRSNDDDIRVVGINLHFSDDEGDLDQGEIDDLLGTLRLRSADGGARGSHGVLIGEWGTATIETGVASFSFDASLVTPAEPLVDSDGLGPLLTVLLVPGTHAAGAVDGALRVSFALEPLDAVADDSDLAVLVAPSPNAPVAELTLSGDPPDEDPIFSDDFELGDTSAWSSES